MSKNTGLNLWSVDETGNKRVQVIGSFLNQVELFFLRVLEQAVGDCLIIFPKVHLRHIFYVIGSDGENFINRITRRHVDFLLCNRETMKPVLGLELDEDVGSCEQQFRNLDLELVFEAAGLPLARVRVAKEYREKDLREYLLTLGGLRNDQETGKMQELSVSGEGISELLPEAATETMYKRMGGAGEQAPPGDQSGANQIHAGRKEPEKIIEEVVTAPVLKKTDYEKWKKQAEEEVISAYKEDEAPVCPRCRVNMELRTSRRGFQYFGCPNFPQCKEFRGLYE
jgi:hypothetical protein